VQKLVQTVKQEQEARKLLNGELLTAQESFRQLSAKYEADKQLFQQSYQILKGKEASEEHMSLLAEKQREIIKLKLQNQQLKDKQEEISETSVTLV
jgi:hypothetical protein